MKKLSEQENNTFIYVILGLIIAIVAVIIILRQYNKVSTDPRALPLAQCLTQKGFKFYGASWCSHCAQQKLLFGDAAKSLPYVECFDPGASTLNKTCQDAKIQGYPTWVSPDNQRREGEQSIEQLAEFSGCKI